MTDDQLAKYLPKFGDRVAAKAFAKVAEEKKPEDHSSEQKKKNLLTRVKERFQGKAMSSGHYSGREKHIGNENAKRSKRRVDIGWLDFCKDTNQYKQVRGPSGGGTRNVEFDVDATMNDVLHKSKQLFFPEGTSRRGELADHDCFITDNTHNPLTLDITVAEMYKHMNPRILHLYLATKKRDQESTDELSDLEMPQKSPKKRYKPYYRKKSLEPQKSSGKRA